MADVGKLSHVDEAGQARMVDVAGKPVSHRQAVARGRVKMQPATLDALKSGTVAKGNVLAVARLAGIMAAKRTPDLIPLCHPLLLDDVNVELHPDEAASTVEITASVKCEGKTGVEMEALTAVTVAALTIYDMCKAIDPGMSLEDIRLVSKSGGKSGRVDILS